MSIEAAILQNQILEPKSSVGVFDLPCGYLDEGGVLHKEVVVKEITGAEEDMLASKKTPPHKKMNELLNRCTDRIGSLVERSQIVAAVPKLLEGDRIFLIFAIRRVTLGDEYSFKERCTECGKEDLYTVQLNELDIKEMPEPSKRFYDKTLPSGKSVRFHPLTGQDEEKLAKAGGDGRSTAMLLRMDLMDGKPPSLADVQKLSLRDRNALSDFFEEVDGGVDTAIQLDCSHCGVEFEKELDVQAGFFFPSGMRKSSKKKSSS